MTESEEYKSDVKWYGRERANERRAERRAEQRRERLDTARASARAQSREDARLAERAKIRAEERERERIRKAREERLAKMRKFNAQTDSLLDDVTKATQELFKADNSVELFKSQAKDEAEAINKQVEEQKASVTRRYLLQANIAKEQDVETKQEEMIKLTDLTSSFLVAKGKVVARQAETGLSGNSYRRVRNDLQVKKDRKASDIQIDTDVGLKNIAMSMIAKKVDQEARLQQLDNKKKECSS